MNDRINELLARANSSLHPNPAPPPRPKNRDAVVRDSFDTGMANDLIDAAPDLGDLVDDLSTTFANTRDLTADLLNWFWQRRPDVRELDDLADSHKVNGAVIGELILSADALKLRRMTMGDNYAAAMATLAVEQELRKVLSRHKKLADQTSAVGNADGKLRRSEQALGNAVLELVEKLNTLDPDDPATPGQLDAAADKVEATLVVWVESQQGAADARKGLGWAVEKAQSDLGRAVDKAAEQVHDDLTQQQQVAEAYGYSPADLKAMPFEKRIETMTKLSKTKIGKVADLVGRFRRLQAAEQSRKTDFGKDNIAGTELSDDATRVVAQEWGTANASPELKAMQMAKLTNGELLSRAYKGKEKVGKGAIIVCRDESSSMNKTAGGVSRSDWATAFSLALLQQAKEQGRDFACVSFSTSTRIWRFPKGEATVEQLVEFGEHFFRGGTNVELALDEASKLLVEEFNRDGRPKGDIVFLTDDEFRVSPEWETKFNAVKAEADFRMFGVMIGADLKPHSKLHDLSDNARCVTEFVDPGVVGDIFRSI